MTLGEERAGWEWDPQQQEEEAVMEVVVVVQVYPGGLRAHVCHPQLRLR